MLKTRILPLFCSPKELGIIWPLKYCPTKTCEYPKIGSLRLPAFAQSSAMWHKNCAWGLKPKASSQVRLPQNTGHLVSFILLLLGWMEANGGVSWTICWCFVSIVQHRHFRQNLASLGLVWSQPLFWHAARVCRTILRRANCILQHNIVAPGTFQRSEEKMQSKPIHLGHLEFNQWFSSHAPRPHRYIRPGRPCNPSTNNRASVDTSLASAWAKRQGLGQTTVDPNRKLLRIWTKKRLSLHTNIWTKISSCHFLRKNG